MFLSACGNFIATSAFLPASRRHYPGMRDLVRMPVMLAAGAAAGLTALACSPRLALWQERREQLWFLILVLLWGAFCLWNFVFAWHRRHTGRAVVQLRPPARIWLAATAGGLAGAGLIHFFFDPTLRTLAPQDYPTNLKMWGAMTLFVLAFDQLFLCFAPAAFFARLFRKTSFILAGTIMASVAVMLLKIGSSPQPPPVWIVAGLAGLRVISTGLAVHLYLGGGVLPVWWFALLIQMRHLPGLLAGH